MRNLCFWNPILTYSSFGSRLRSGEYLFSRTSQQGYILTVYSMYSFDMLILIHQLSLAYGKGPQVKLHKIKKLLIGIYEIKKRALRFLLAHG